MEAKKSAVGKTMGTERYVIRGGVEGRERLRLLSEVMGTSTRALLTEVGIPSGAICLDVGCGGGDVTFELARAAGPTGRAIGVDLDDIKLDIARREAAHQDLSNITFEARDVTEWDPSEHFDVIYARFLLTHLADPAALVSVLRQKLRRGGVIIVEDIDYRGHFTEPDCRALVRAVEFYTKSVQARGADPKIGPRLPRMLRESGARRYPDEVGSSRGASGWDQTSNLCHPGKYRGRRGSGWPHHRGGAPG